LPAEANCFLSLNAIFRYEPTVQVQIPILQPLAYQVYQDLAILLETEIVEND
jgi:hypothetical protein